VAGQVCGAKVDGKGDEIQFADQDLPQVFEALCLAQEMGAGLGAGQILLGALQAGKVGRIGLSLTSRCLACFAYVRFGRNNISLEAKRAPLTISRQASAMLQ
jgi:predicted hotdog family 3-hydroxylacyl-ACP dehydratase